MTAAHTPGPWVAHEDRCAGGHKVTASAIHIAANTPANLRDHYTCLVVATQRNAHPLYDGGISDDVALANARLIAAAPEMLAALHAVADQLLYQIEKRGTESLRPVFGQVLDAIDKAEGRA